MRSQEIHGGSCDIRILFVAECVNRIHFEAAAIESTFNHPADNCWPLSKSQLKLIAGGVLEKQAKLKDLRSKECVLKDRVTFTVHLVCRGLWANVVGGETISSAVINVSHNHHHGPG
jgi:hypothetical protein